MSNRQALTEGGWFDVSKAIKFDEDSWWNGNNHISRATGSQWNHEALYYTRSGNWVLNSWSQYQGVAETYERISESEAARWLISNDRDDELAELPADVRAKILTAVAEEEV